MDKKEILEAILNKPKRLQPGQERAVISDKIYLRIIAGAGAGKTETLTRRIAYLLLCKDVEPKAIVGFTFTERAAQSIKDRIYKRISMLQGEEACKKLGEMYVGTIHAYCFKILQEHFGLGDYEVIDDNQEIAFLMRLGWSFGLGTGGKYSENCKNFIRSVNVVYDELLERSDISKKDNRFAEHLEQYEKTLLKEHRLLTFGLLTSLAVKKLEENPDILSQVNYLIVDEYQDVNRAQERLIQIIGKNASVFVVGDPRQCIYQWRGSDQKCFDSFLKRFSDSDSIPITENHRSAKLIVNLANKFASTFESAKYDSMSSTRPEYGTVLLMRCDDDISEADWITSQVKRLIEDKKICKYSDIAILLRSVSTSAGSFIDFCRSKDIPYLVGGKVGLFRRDEAQAIGRIFAWFADKFWIEDTFKWSDRAENKRLMDSAIDRWKSALRIKSTPANLSTNLQGIKDDVLNGKYKSLTKIYYELLVMLKFLDLDPNDRLHAAIMANLGRFNELLTDYESSIRRGGISPNWKKDLEGLCWYMNSYATGAYEEQPAEDLRGTDVLQIMTIHQAKGLEWPIVFVPCLVNRRFPTSKVGKGQDWYVPKELFDFKRYQGDIEDERRLFYVAITRARDVLTISRFAQLNSRVRAPSIFWDALERHLSESDQKVSLNPSKIEQLVDIEEMQTYTAGEIINYKRCPYMYRLRKMWGYQPPDLPLELGYGKSLHYCLHLASQKLRKGMKLEKAVSEAVAEKFHLPFADYGRKKKIQETAEKKLLEFARKNIENLKNIEETESRLEFPIESAIISGRVDVIIRDKPKDKLEIRDYKTSDEVTTLDESSLQLRLYTLGLRSLGCPIERATIAYLEDGKTSPPINIDDKELEESKKVAKECLEGIQKACFKPKEGNHCKERCDQRQICKFYNR